MRLTDYDFVFDGWQPGFKVLASGYSLCTHLGLPYIEFHVVTSEFAVSVRCDPCSAEEAKAGYAGMVRHDLAKAIAKRLCPGLLR